MSIKRISIKGLIKNPNFASIYKDYDRLSVDDYGGLFVYLYSGRLTGWENPLTGKELKRSSNRIISFLSYCYYKLDDGSKVNIRGKDMIYYNLTYKEHVLNFVDEIYLYEEDRKTALAPAASARAARSAPVAFKARSPSPTRGTAQAATRRATAQPAARGPVPKVDTGPFPVLNPVAFKARSPSPARGTAQAARGAKSSSSSGRMSYSPRNLYKSAQRLNSPKLANKKLTEKECIAFVEEIRKLKKGLSSAEIKELRIMNPLTNKTIGFRNPNFQNLLFKCYTSFDNEKLKKSIRKVVSKNFLDDLQTHINSINADQAAHQSAADKAKETKRLAEEKKKAEAKDAENKMRVKNKLVCEEYIEGCMKDFHKRCDELEAACDRNGVLREYEFITKVVNAIVVVILTKYLHLNTYYDDLYETTNYDKPLPIWLIMYDDAIKDYYEAKNMNVVGEMIDYAYNKGTVVYQNNDLKQNVTKGVIDTIPRINETYSLNTLLNRQYIFDISKKDNDNYGRSARDNVFITPSVVYNHFNELDTRKYSTLPFPALQFPHTLHYALQQFSFRPFKYNITNSGLPRTIFIATTEAVLNRHKPFSEIGGEINERLARMPRITGIAKEATVRHEFYEDVLKGMEKQSFGTNDVIRRNIMYSLNAQTPDYVARAHNYYQNIFYNYGYTGMFPIFTWIPLSKDTNGSICSLANSHLWQPFGSNKNKEFQALGNAYKNHGISPWSKMLNEAIYKVITKVHSSVLDIPNTQAEKDRLLMRIMDTLGVYKSMDIDAKYSNENLYFYHGTANRLHTMKDRDNDIQILGFLSTSLNIYTASYYSEVVTRGAGYIYIIESDDKKGYVNLNDQLYQYILLPNSIIRIVYEFNRGAHTIILCRLIMTPTKEENNALYENLLGMVPATGAAAAAGPAGAAAGPAGAGVAAAVAAAGSSGSSGSSGSVNSSASLQAYLAGLYQGSSSGSPRAASPTGAAGAAVAASGSPKLSGGLLNMNDAYGMYAANAANAANPKAVRSLMAKQAALRPRFAAPAAHARSHSDTKNIIKPKADMRKIGDMPADIREYYGLTLTEQNKNEKVDINNGCYVRLISRKVVDRMLADRV